MNKYMALLIVHVDQDIKKVDVYKSVNSRYRSFTHKFPQNDDVNMYFSVLGKINTKPCGSALS